MRPLPAVLLYARASRVKLSSNTNTSRPCSVRRFAAFDHQFRDADVVRGVAVGATRDHFAFLQTALHLGHFFRPLIDQKNDQVHVGVVRDEGLRDVLKEYRFAGSRRGRQSARARPMPIGVNMSITRVVSGSAPVSRRIHFVGSTGVSSSQLRRRYALGSPPSICSMVAKRGPCPRRGGSSGPPSNTPSARLNLSTSCPET